jgi:hypothetical protein
MVNTNIEEPTSQGVDETPPLSSETTVEEPTEPTETGEPVTPEEPAETPEEPPGAAPAAEPVKKGKTAQQRIQELVAEREKEKAEKEYYRGLAEGRTKPPEKPPETPAQAGPPPKPKPEDFEDWDQYEAAREEYVISMAEYRISQKQAQETSQTTTQQRVQKIVSAHEERMTKYAEVDPEIKEIAKDPELPLSEPMRAAVMLTEDGPKLIRYLHEHKDEAKRIYDLAPMVKGANGTWTISPNGNPFMAFLEMGRIAGILASQPPEPPKPVKPKSHTPEPHQPVGGNTGGGGPKGDLAELAKTDPTEYLKRVREGKG